MKFVWVCVRGSVCPSTSAHPWYFPSCHSRARLPQAKVLDLRCSLLYSSFGFFTWSLFFPSQSHVGLKKQPPLVRQRQTESVRRRPKHHAVGAQQRVDAPLNWHKAATPSCRRNELMFSSIDCSLLTFAGPAMLAGEMRDLSRRVNITEHFFDFFLFLLLEAVFCNFWAGFFFWQG